MYDLNKTSTNKMDLINDFAKKAESEGIEFIGLSDTITVENTVENLSTPVHGYPLWFSNVTL